MSLKAVITKEVRQRMRDRLTLVLTLLTVPFFTMAYGLVFSQETIHVAVAKPTTNIGHLLLKSVYDARSPDGENLFNLHLVADTSVLREQVEAGIWNAGVILPTAVITGSDSPPRIIMLGPVQRPKTMLTFAQLERILRGTLAQLDPDQPKTPVFAWEEAGPPGPQTTFDQFVPGLLAFAIIMLIFSSALALSREIERGTLLRLQLTAVKPWHLVAGMGLVQTSLGILCVAITLTTAIALGFKAQGSLVEALLFVSLGCLSSIGIGLIIACLMKTTSRSFLVASFVMFLLLVFSGIIFPKPEGNLGTVMGYQVAWIDILPTTHLRIALDRILASGWPASRLVYPLTWMTLQSTLILGTGIFLFGQQGPKGK
jgi:hypothetical protein